MLEFLDTCVSSVSVVIIKQFGLRLKFSNERAIGEFENVRNKNRRNIVLVLVAILVFQENIGFSSSHCR